MAVSGAADFGSYPLIRVLLCLAAHSLDHGPGPLTRQHEAACPLIELQCRSSAGPPSGRPGRRFRRLREGRGSTAWMGRYETRRDVMGRLNRAAG